MNKYYEDKTLKEYTTIIKDTLNIDNKHYVKLNEYIFYPQGGGQKGDRGTLVVDNDEYNIINTIKDFNDNNDILIIIDKEMPKSNIGKEVECLLDYEYRYKQMRLHTALHLFHYLLGEILQKDIDNPTISSIDDGFAFNKYQENIFDISVVDEVIAKHAELRQQDIAVVTYPDKDDENYRWWNIFDYHVGCGGIHVDYLNEIGDIDFKVTNKKGFITIKIILND